MLSSFLKYPSNSRLDLRYEGFSFYGPRKSDEGADTDGIIFAGLLACWLDFSLLLGVVNRVLLILKNITIMQHNLKKTFTGILHR